MVELSAQVGIISSVSRTKLVQTFVNPSSDIILREVKYAFPLYDGISVVGFTCTIGDRVLGGVVMEQQDARGVYRDAVERGETAGLLEQLPQSSDVFMTSVGNVDGGASVRVEITYLGELKHDAEVDGIRFTLPTRIAPRYGNYPGELISGARGHNRLTASDSGIDIVVDAEVAADSAIRSIQSTSHPISVSIGTTSAAPNAAPSLRKASASLSLGPAELDRDFVLQIVATNASNPTAVLEQHPTLPRQRALMATLVPKFALPLERPEIVFLCDRSGSMSEGNKIPNLKEALRVFLKSLPVGVKFNICSFGSRYSPLWERSQSYHQSTLDQAFRHVDEFAANYGGTEIYEPMEAMFSNRYLDMNLEVFLLTDGEIWDQPRLIGLVNDKVAESSGAIRVFTLGIGRDASSALIDGVSRAGNGFSQSVGDNEKMNSKVVRMLKAALSPHIRDYSMEVKYESKGVSLDDGQDDDFELIDNIDNCVITDGTPRVAQTQMPISLFDAEADLDVKMQDACKVGSTSKYDHLPAITSPRIIQAPFQISPLFAFSRTTVYLLMSESAVQQKVKSVVLRGTSTHGPLELEIPVTTLDEPGQTIHQLAARRAMQELEEGRGWLYHAKDENQRLLRKKYEGRFSDIVEREAVSMGLRYQVGGKWCSFVAVEQRVDGNGTPKDGRMYKLLEPTRRMKMEICPGSQASSYGAAPSSLFGVPGHNPTSTGSSLFYELAASPAFSNDSLDFVDSVDLDCSAVSGRPAFGAPLPAAAHPMGAFLDASIMRSPAAPRFAQAGNLSLDEMAGRGANSRSNTHGRNATARESSHRGYRQSADSEADRSEMLGHPMLSPDPMRVIVSLQTFKGYWTASEKLLSVIGTSRGQMEDVLAKRSDGWAASLARESDMRVATTVCVLVFLAKKLSGEMDTWELMADKARDWLSALLASLGTDINAVEETLEHLV